MPDVPQSILDDIIEDPHTLENIDYCEKVYYDDPDTPVLINIWFNGDIDNASCSPDYEDRAEDNSFCALVKAWADAGNTFRENRYPLDDE